MRKTSLKFAITLILANFCEGAYQEDDCTELRGTCQDDNQTCLGGEYQSGKCPTQAGHIRCCVPSGYPEEPCTGLGGTCQRNDLPCSGGQYQSGKCPTQANNIKCCVSGGAYQEEPCTGLGGTCQVDSLSCPNGQYQSGKCPTQAGNIRCCVRGGCPRIISRSGWNARSPRGRTTIGKYLPYWFIHHSAGNPCSSQSSCASAVRGIQNYHMNSRGYSDIGYSFLVGGDGSIFEGRGWQVSGAHTRGYNSRGYAICFIGNFGNTRPTSAAIQAAQSLISCGVKLGMVSSYYKLYGHRQAGSTTCPGNTLYSLIQSWPRWTSGRPN